MTPRPGTHPAGPFRDRGRGYAPNGARECARRVRQKLTAGT